MAITGSTQITALELALEQALTEWLPGQRWFAGKGRPITGLEITADTELAAGRPGQARAPGEPALRHLIVAVSQDGPVPGPGHPPLPGGTDSYQVLVGLREDLPGWLEHVRIGVIPDGRVAYDALYDHELAGLLLRAIATQQVIGPVRFARVPGIRSGAGPLDRLARAPGPARAPIQAAEPGQARAPGADLDSLVLTGEQSNTSLVYGEEAILKVFRRVAPGPNPELEVSAALGRLGSEHIAEPFGWIETCHGGEVTILAILSRYLRAASDGWSLAATSVRDLYALPGTRAAEAGGDFAPEARRLGAATAEVHEDLVRAFGSAELPGGAASLAGPMRHRLEIALAAVPALREYEALLTAAYAELARLDGPVPVQRIHGDYHLGQVMRTQTGWVVLDFEGEPAVPLVTRLAMSSPLRDVAGMLRSFDYAARHQLLGHRDRAALELLARDWVRRSREAFCAGYAEAGGQARAPGADPRESGVLLRAFELDKAVYEVVYEASNRPSWLPIPLDSLAALPATERDTP
jgi:maltokinase